MREKVIPYFINFFIINSVRSDILNLRTHEQNATVLLVEDAGTEHHMADGCFYSPTCGLVPIQRFFRWITSLTNPLL